MVKSKNIIAGLGVVAGLGMALLPLGAFATVDGGPKSEVIRATVAEEFTLTVARPEDYSTMTETGAGTVSLNRGTSANTTLIHTVNVNGNLYNGYDLTMYGTTDLLRVVDASKDFGANDRYDSNTKIATGTTLSGSTSAWGYKKNVNNGGYDESYSTIKAQSSADTLYSNVNTSHVSFNDTVLVNFGIYAAENQAAGVYEGTVTYKATPKP